MSRATMLDPHLEEENAENIENEVQETQQADAEESVDAVDVKPGSYVKTPACP